MFKIISPDYLNSLARTHIWKHICIHILLNAMKSVKHLYVFYVIYVSSSELWKWMWQNNQNLVSIIIVFVKLREIFRSLPGIITRITQTSNTCYYILIKMLKYIPFTYFVFCSTIWIIIKARCKMQNVISMLKIPFTTYYWFTKHLLHWMYPQTKRW